MSTVSKQIEEETLIRLLFKRQPDSKGSFEFLRKHFAGKGGHGALAPIKGERCGVCNLSIPQAMLQLSKNGSFITCANCARFLYWPETVLVESNIEDKR